MYGLKPVPFKNQNLFSPDTHSSKPIGLQALRYALPSMPLRKFKEINTSGPKGQRICPVDVRAKAQTTQQGFYLARGCVRS